MKMNKKAYQSPELEVIGIRAESIICVSGEDVTVTNPWEGNTEQDW